MASFSTNASKESNNHHEQLNQIPKTSNEDKNVLQTSLNAEETINEEKWTFVPRYPTGIYY